MVPASFFDLKSLFKILLTTLLTLKLAIIMHEKLIVVLTTVVHAVAVPEINVQEESRVGESFKETFYISCH